MWLMIADAFSLILASHLLAGKKFYIVVISARCLPKL
jgi:hypothetical protein